MNATRGSEPGQKGAFEVKVLEHCLSREELGEAERSWIAGFKNKLLSLDSTTISLCLALFIIPESQQLTLALA
jgi:hypothetical protein